MLLIMCGKSSSGKDTIADKLCSEYGFRKMVAYTTRPKRGGEKDGKEYFFIKEDKWEDMVKDNMFIETKSYQTALGIWKYGSPVSFFEGIVDDKNYVAILTPKGYKDFLKRINIKHKCIYVYANSSTIKNRLNKRKDNIEEANRRMTEDRKDFKGFEEVADKIFYNNEQDDIDGVVKKIAEYIKGES